MRVLAFYLMYCSVCFVYRRQRHRVFSCCMVHGYAISRCCLVLSRGPCGFYLGHVKNSYVV